MKLLVLLGLISIISAVHVVPSTDPDNVIDNKYIVVFHKNATEDAVLRYFSYTTRESLKIKSFEIGTFRGVFTQLNARQLLEHVTFDETINYIEHDHVITLSQNCVTQHDAEWGLDRISERLLDLTDAAAYVYESHAGKGVTSYIVDTGIRTTHAEFEGRASWGANFVDTDDTDCNGHGTHVAGTIAGKTYGVAKAANVVAVKVLNCAGSGTWSGVIAGVEYVAKQGKKPGNANLSLGGSKSQSLNDAVAAAVEAGFPFIVAAGNSNADACGFSPASEPTAITVGSTALGVDNDIRSSFSNFGSCVDIFAPGSNIMSAWHTHDTATNRISGTSMASPHVAGLASMIQSKSPNISPAEVESQLVAEANADVIDLDCLTTACDKSPNALAYHFCQ